jgi:predicted permease
VGVTPAGFTGVAEGAPPVVFVPLTTFGRNEGGGNGADYFEAYNWDWTEMIVRRKTGVTVTAATLDLTNAFRRSRDVARARHSWMPRTDRAPARAIAGPLREAAGPNPGLEARTLVWLTAVAGIVLLIACANVANLVLARALRRQREVALRLALGVTRRRLAAQSLTEVLVLTLLGCVAGIAIAAWAGASLHKLIMPDGSVYSPWSDGRTLGIAIATTLVAGLLTGLAPLAFAVRADINTTLKWAARQGSYQHTRARAALLVVQGALSVLLLTGAALFVRSLENVRDMRLGYDADSLLLVRVHSRGVALDEHEQAALRERLLERALAIASVQRGAWVSTVPFLGSSTRGLAVPGIDSVPLLGRFDYQTVSSDYFATMGTRIVRGRPFNETDRAGSAPVAVVSEGMARTIWPGQDALGQCIRVSGWNERADTMPCTTVVGIAEDALYDPEADRPFRYYLPIEHFPHDGGSLLVLRVGAVPATLAEEVRGALQRAMPGPSYVTAGPARLHIDAQRRPWRLGAAVLSAFGVLALIVAAVGSYGVIAYSVAQRMHELGVRIALGAQRRDVARLVLGLGVRFALAGVLLGNALALTVAPWIEPLLFRQSARDPALFGAVATLLVAVALVASAVPAIRATHADPNTVLRAE